MRRSEKCAEEHRQLADWLRELKELREKVSCSERPNSLDFPTQMSGTCTNVQNMHVASDLISRKAMIEKAYIEEKGMPEPFRSNFAVMVDWLASKMPSEQLDLTKLEQELWAKTWLITDIEGVRHQVIHATDLRMVIGEVMGWTINV